MEHIQDDFKAFEEQVRCLQNSTAVGPKRIIAVIQAPSFAFGSFDHYFNHFSRYEGSGPKAIFKKIDPSI